MSMDSEPHRPVKDGESKSKDVVITQAEAAKAMGVSVGIAQSRFLHSLSIGFR
jgi:hypothetical protein